MAAGDVDVKITKNRAFSCNICAGSGSNWLSVPHHWRQLGANLPNGFTLSAWIMPRSLGEGSAGKIIDKSTGASGAGGFVLAMYGSGGNERLEFNINNGTRAESASPSMTLGRWSHILVTVTSAQRVNFYINGALSGNANQNVVQTIAAMTTTNTVIIGDRQSADRNFDGGLREIKMWDRVLSSTEIAQDYAGYIPATGLIHRFKMGGDYADYGLAGAAGTVTGTASGTMEDTVAAAIKTQRTATGATGTFLMCRGAGGQVVHVAIDE